MNTYSRLLDQIDTPADAAPPVRGHWRNLRFTPDPASGETLNIGVVFQSADGDTHLRVLDDFRRLRCLYRQRFDPEHLRFLIRALHSGITAETLPSPQLALSAPKLAAGNSVNELLDMLFAETVTLAGAIDDTEDSDEVADTLSTEQARQQVFDAMKRRDPWSVRMIAEDPTWHVADEDTPHTLDMPLRDVGCYGSILSAWYRDRSALELQLLRGTLDLGTAARLHPDQRGGLFILRPPAGAARFSETHQRQIDNVIDMMAWRLRLQETQLDVADDADQLAEYVLAWGAAAA
jgi:hypothetical protein